MYTNCIQIGRETKGMEGKLKKGKGKGRETKVPSPPNSICCLLILHLYFCQSIPTCVYAAEKGVSLWVGVCFIPSNKCRLRLELRLRFWKKRHSLCLVLDLSLGL